nr:hypothetical protein [uncultured Sulfitobacter sp.]
MRDLRCPFLDGPGSNAQDRLWRSIQGRCKIRITYSKGGLPLIFQAAVIDPIRAACDFEGRVLCLRPAFTPVLQESLVIPAPILVLGPLIAVETTHGAENVSMSVSRSTRHWLRIMDANIGNHASRYQLILRPGQCEASRFVICHLVRQSDLDLSSKLAVLAPLDPFYSVP